MTRRCRSNERGAVLVEAAIATPVVMLLLFSVIWGALVFRTYLTVEQASSVGARAATVAGSDPRADYDILQAVQQNTAALGKQSLERVVVYRATGFDQKPSATCMTGPGGATGCNVYFADDLAMPESQFGAGGWADDDYFPATTRNDSRGTETFVGVYVKARPMAGGSGLPVVQTVESWKVLRVEAKSF